MKNVHVIEVEVKGKDWEKALDEAFKKKVKDTTIPGFRKGKCPKNVYIQKFGIESLFMDAIDQASGDAYMDTLKKENIVPVVEPKMDIKEIDEKHVKFEFTLISHPEVKLGKYKDLGVKKDKVTVTREEVEAEVVKLESKLADIVVKENGEVVEGNTAVIDFDGTVDKKPLEGGSGKNYPLEIGSHTFIPGFEEGIVGMKKGETKTLKLTFPENYTKELAGKKVEFKVTVNEIKERVLPELNKEFYEDLGYNDIKTEAEFKEEVKKALTQEKEKQAQDKYVDDVLEAASKNLKVEINDEIVDEEVHRMMNQFSQQLKMQGLTLEQYMEFSGMKHEDFHKQMEPEAKKRITYRYLIEAIADEEKIEISDKEADKEAEKMAETYGVTKEEMLSQFGGLDVVKYDMRMRKALEIISEN